MIDRIEILWPEDFEDFAWEIEAKGCLFGLKVRSAGQTIALTFYDKARLSQDIEAELASAGLFAESALVVLNQLTKRAIEDAIVEMARSGALQRLAPPP